MISSYLIIIRYLIHKEQTGHIYTVIDDTGPSVQVSAAPWKCPWPQDITSICKTLELWISVFRKRWYHYLQHFAEYRPPW
jgi:hypothetical protein